MSAMKRDRRKFIAAIVCLVAVNVLGEIVNRSFPHLQKTSPPFFYASFIALLIPSGMAAGYLWWAFWDFVYERIAIYMAKQGPKSDSPKQRRTKVLRIWFVLACLLFMFMGNGLITGSWDLATRGTTTEGHRLRTRAGEDVGYEFKVGAKRYKSLPEEERGKQYEEGPTVAVVYDPDDPNISQTEPVVLQQGCGLLLVAIFTSIFSGLVTLYVWWIILMFQRNAEKVRRELAKEQSG